MSNLSVIEKPLSIWESEENKAQIKQIFAPKLNSNEFTIFVEMGKATGLNPFLKEIWAVKYDERSAAQIFIGRDGYRKSAQRHHAYDYHTCDAVYSNDLFKVVNGEVTHEYKLNDRGQLMGAYCLVQRKGSSRPTYVFAELREYNTNKSVWVGKPATMIKKVAEAQALKAAFQELFSGTYSEYEQYEPGAEIATLTKQGKGVAGLKDKLGIAEPEIQDAEFNQATGEVVEAEQPTEPAKPQADTVIFLIENASIEQELNEAMKDFKALPQSDKKRVYDLYKAKLAELKQEAK